MNGAGWAFGSAESSETDVDGSKVVYGAGGFFGSAEGAGSDVVYGTGASCAGAAAGGKAGVGDETGKKAGNHRANTGHDSGEIGTKTGTGSGDGVVRKKYACRAADASDYAKDVDDGAGVYGHEIPSQGPELDDGRGEGRVARFAHTVGGGNFGTPRDDVRDRNGNNSLGGVWIVASSRSGVPNGDDISGDISRSGVPNGDDISGDVPTRVAMPAMSSRARSLRNSLMVSGSRFSAAGGNQSSDASSSGDKTPGVIIPAVARHPTRFRANDDGSDGAVSTLNGTNGTGADGVLSVTSSSGKASEGLRRSGSLASTNTSDTKTYTQRSGSLEKSNASVGKSNDSEVLLAGAHNGRRNSVEGEGRRDSLVSEGRRGSLVGGKGRRPVLASIPGLAPDGTLHGAKATSMRAFIKAHASQDKLVNSPHLCGFQLLIYVRCSSGVFELRQFLELGRQLVSAKWRHPIDYLCPRVR